MKNLDKIRSKISMDLDIEYLLTYLQDDLGGFDEVRIQAIAPTGTQKAPDLPQDYDPYENDLHIKRGVRVRVGSREFFFPDYWVKNGQFEKVRELADEIKKNLNLTG